MKVLQVTREMPGDERYGLGRAVAQLNAGLAADGVAVGMLRSADLPAQTAARASERAGRWAQAHGSALQGLFEVVSRAWETGRLAAQLAQAQGYTHVHCHDAVVAHGVLSVPGVARQPLGTTQHGFHGLAQAVHRHVLPLPDAVAGLLDRLERQALRGLDWVVFPTPSGAREWAAELGLPGLPRQAQVIPHARPAWPATRRAQARATLGWPEGDAVLLAVGQLIPLKRLDWVVRALAQAGPGWRLVILGEGDAQPLRQLAQDLGAPPPLVVASDQPWLYFAAADAFTSASATESFGMAHLEALCAGLPIACTAVGGVPDVTGDAALLLADDEAAYAAGLCQLLQQPALGQRLAARAAARAADWPDCLAVAQRHRGVYAAAGRETRAVEVLDEPF